MHKLHGLARSSQVVGQFVLRSLGLSKPKRPDQTSVLVVDDEPQVCQFVSVVLSRAGYRVTKAEHAAAALAAVEQNGPPDLLLTDLKMPHMDGDELAAKLRQSVPDLKVLYLTGFTQALFKSRGVLWEGEAFLEKPCSPKLLLEGVSMILFDRVMSATASAPRQ